MEERVPGGRMEVMLDSEPRSLGTTEEDAVKHADPQGLPSNTQTPLSVTKTTQTRCEFALEEETVSQMQSQIENQSPTLRDSNRLSQTETQMLPQTRAQTLTQTQTEEFLILDQNGQPLRCEHMVIVSGQSESEEVFVIPSAQLEGAQVLLDITEPTGCCGVKTAEEELRTITLTADEAEAQEQSSQGCFTPPLKPLPSNAPNWALRLHNAEKIGDSYRGYCNTETELETILLLHKQQTNTVFGTRQSPSPAKPATRLMWKSQYVPYDGIPFVNAGSRAIVMECEFGPRRKGLQPKRTAEQTICHCIDYKATCPARIYIKKVRKFPQYRVPTDPNVDKKVVRQEQEKAFFNLRKTLWDVGGVLRYYMQLPTQNAHLYHDIAPTLPPPPPELLCPSLEVKQQEEEEEEECVFEGGAEEDGGSVPSRLHPQVADKIRELVEQGHDQVYQVRKQLRRFVEREMFKTEEVPERHNLCYFPTVNDIKNHIHEAQKTVQQNMLVSDAQWGAVGQPIMTQTVTLSLTPASAEGSLQRVGVLEGSDTFSPEAVQLFSSLTSLQPKVVAHLQGIQIPVGVCSSDPAQSPATSPDSLALPTPSCLGSLTVSPTLGKAMGTGHVVSVSSLGDGQLVSISSLGDGQLVNTSSLEVESSGTHNIVLENGQVIPVQVLDPATIALTNPDVAKQDDVKQKEDITVQPRD